MASGQLMIWLAAGKNPHTVGVSLLECCATKSFFHKSMFPMAMAQSLARKAAVGMVNNPFGEPTSKLTKSEQTVNKPYFCEAMEKCQSLDESRADLNLWDLLFLDKLQMSLQLPLVAGSCPNITLEVVMTSWKHGPCG